MKKIILIGITTVVIICDLVSQTQKHELNLKLNYGFELRAIPAYPNEDISSYNYLKLFKNGTRIFEDTTLTEWTFEDSLYPKLYDFKDHFELLIEVENRPFKNRIYRFFIESNQINKIDTLPTFLTKPKDLDQDNKLEYAGFWDYGEVWGDSIEVTAYNPILFYEITENGIIMDSITTKNVNSNIFGQFYGFHFNEKIEIQYKRDSKLTTEIKNILNK